MTTSLRSDRSAVATTLKGFSLVLVLFGQLGCGETSNPTSGRQVHESLNSPVFSLDGTAVFFDALESNRCGVFRFDRDTSNVLSLTMLEDWETRPIVSPTTDELAFARVENRYQHIWMMNTNGQGRRQITSGEVVDSPHRFSNDGSHIFFLRTLLSQKGQFLKRQICDVSVATPGPVKVLGAGVAASDDGRYIISEQFDTRLNQNALWLKDTQTQAQRFFAYGYTPYFSQDGTSVVYLKPNADFTSEICTKGVANNQETALPTPRGYKTAPLYNWHANSISFRIPTSTRDGRGGLFAIDPQSGSCVKLGNVPGGGDPNWIVKRSGN